MPRNRHKKSEGRTMQHENNKERLIKKYRKRDHVLLLLIEDDDDRVWFFNKWHRLANHPDRVAAMPFKVVHAKSAGSAIGILSRDTGTIYDGIILDYDLDRQKMSQHEKQYNGNDVVNAIIRGTSNSVPVMIHSTNPKGGEVMAQRLSGAGFSVERTPFNSLTMTTYWDWLKYVVENSEKLLV